MNVLDVYPELGASALFPSLSSNAPDPAPNTPEASTATAPNSRESNYRPSLVEPSNRWRVGFACIPAIIFGLLLISTVSNWIAPDPNPEMDRIRNQAGLKEQKRLEEEQKRAVAKLVDDYKKAWEKAKEDQIVPLPFDHRPLEK